MEDLSTIGGRLQKAMDVRNYTPYRLFKDTGISQSTIGRILKNEGKNKPNRTTINTLGFAMEVNPDWIYDNTEPFELPNGSTPPEPLNANDAFELAEFENKNANYFSALPNGQYVMTMPLAEVKIQAGLLDHFQDVDYIKGLEQHSIIVDKPLKGRYLAFRVSGDSMDDNSKDAIPAGYIVSTRELQQHHWRSKLRFKDYRFWVIYTSQARMPLLKEIVGHDTESGIITCHSLNDSPEYNDFDLSLNDVQALFYVVDVHRKTARDDYY